MERNCARILFKIFIKYVNFLNNTPSARARRPRTDGTHITTHCITKQCTFGTPSTAGEKDAGTKSHPEVHNGKSPKFRRENRIGMDRTGVNRVGWVGLDWTGLDWTGLDRIGPDRIGPDRIGMDRTGVNRVRPGRAGLNRARLDWADRTGLGWAGLDSSRNQAMTAPQQRHTTTHPSTKRSCNSSGSPSQMRPTMRPAAMSTERIRRSRSRSSSRRPAYL